MHLVLFPLICVFACLSTYLCVFPSALDSEHDRKLLCACENNKGTCLNETCRGDICFYTWVHGNEDRGCFSAVNYLEQCFTSFERFFVHCCKENLCNAFTTPPPDIGQYPKPRLYNIWTSHPWNLKNQCGIEPPGLLLMSSQALLCIDGIQSFPL